MARGATRINDSAAVSMAFWVLSDTIPVSATSV